MRALAESDGNSGGSWTDLLVLPLPAFGHFWFLWAVLINTAVFTALHLIFRRFIPDIWFWAIFLAICPMARFTITLPQQYIPFFGQALNYSLAFTMGALIGRSPLREMVPSRAVALLGFLLFSLGLWVSVVFEMSVSVVVRGSLLALCLLLPLALLSADYGRSTLARGVAFLGTISLAIYVMHTMFSAAFRILLLKLGIDDSTTHLLVRVIAGILGPLAIYLFMRRIGILRAAGLA